MAQLTRTQLKQYFGSNSTITSQEMSDLIDSLYNIQDDGEIPSLNIFVTLNGVEILTNKTLIQPKINGDTPLTITSSKLNEYNRAVGTNVEGAVVITDTIQTLVNKTLDRLRFPDSISVNKIIDSFKPAPMLKIYEEQLMNCTGIYNTIWDALGKVGGGGFIGGQINPTTSINLIYSKCNPNFSTVFFGTTDGSYGNINPSFTITSHHLFAFFVHTYSRTGAHEWYFAPVPLKDSISGGQPGTGGGFDPNATTDLNMQGHSIINLKDPVNKSDAISLNYLNPLEQKFVKLFFKNASYKGQVNLTHTLDPLENNTYIISEAGTYGGVACVRGDVLYYKGDEWIKANAENKDFLDFVSSSVKQDINMDGKTITNLPLAQADTEPTTKVVTDSQIITTLSNLDTSLVYKGVATVNTVPVSPTDKDTYLAVENGTILGVALSTKGDIIYYDKTEFKKYVKEESNANTLNLGINTHRLSDVDLIYSQNTLSEFVSNVRTFVANGIINLSGTIKLNSSNESFALSNSGTYSLDVTIVVRNSVTTEDFLFKRQIFLSMDIDTTPLVSVVGTDINSITDVATLGFTTTYENNKYYLNTTLQFTKDIEHFCTVYINGIEVVSSNRAT